MLGGAEAPPKFSDTVLLCTDSCSNAISCLCLHKESVLKLVCPFQSPGLHAYTIVPKSQLIASTNSSKQTELVSTRFGQFV